MYAIGDAKYDRSSLFAIASTLLMNSLQYSGFWRGGRDFFGRQRQEDLLEAQAHRSQLEQPPPAGHDRPREIAAHVMSLLALDLVADDPVAAVRFRHPTHAGDSRQRGWPAPPAPVDPPRQPR